MTPKLSERMRVRPVVAWFAELMEARLRANDHKTGWLDEHDESLMERLREEMAELETCRPERMADEAADVANFAMMLADINESRIGDKAASDDLKPCPFCRTKIKPNEHNPAWVWHPAHPTCPIADRGFTTRAEYWNTRAEPAPMTPEERTAIDYAIGYISFGQNDDADKECMDTLRALVERARPRFPVTKEGGEEECESESRSR